MKIENQYKQLVKSVRIVKKLPKIIPLTQK